MCDSLWPQIQPDYEDSPKGILQKQIEYLNQSANGQIWGELVLTDGTNYETKKSLKEDVGGSTDDVCHKLYITAKAKGNVRFLLVSVLQNPLETYPCHLKDEINDIEYRDIETSADFIEKLGSALQSEKVTTLLKNLL
ncbi:MAG: hypothetical protein J6K41_05980 [Paraprevotella sp.]|nr:hypothetical protein [Paraprevotella sp.]